MFCKHCGRKISANSITKCPSCGASINIYDHGQSFYEDNELDAWQDNTPVSSVKKTVMLEPEMNSNNNMQFPSSSPLPGTTVAKDSEPTSPGGILGFFYRNKIAVIISSVSAVVILVAAVVLIAAFFPNNDKNSSSPKAAQGGNNPADDTSFNDTSADTDSIFNILCKFGAVNITGVMENDNEGDYVKINFEAPNLKAYELYCYINRSVVKFAEVGSVVASEDIPDNNFEYKHNDNENEAKNIRINTSAFTNYLKSKGFEEVNADSSSISDIENNSQIPVPDTPPVTGDSNIQNTETNNQKSISRNGKTNNGLISFNAVLEEVGFNAGAVSAVINGDRTTYRFTDNANHPNIVIDVVSENGTNNIRYTDYDKNVENDRAALAKAFLQLII